jgi:uncharacterized membrane protein (UPF0127 family)
MYYACMKRIVLGFLLSALLAAGVALGQGQPAEFGKGRLAIVTDTGPRDFEVELAVTPDQRMQGLMFRRELAPDAGMLFDFGSDPDRASMWMKNTYIPLDMLFIRADGEIESIAERTVPHSLEPISSLGPVRYVLEVNGGTAARLGIRPGDRMKLVDKGAD